MSYDTPQQKPTRSFGFTSSPAARRDDEYDDLIELEFDGCRVYVGDDGARRLIRAMLTALAQKTPTEKTPAEHRKSLDMTQEEAAEHLGVSRTYLSQIECGEASQVSLHIARKMAHLYACSIDELGIEVPAE